MTPNIALCREQEQRVTNDYAALEHQIEWESDHPPEPELKVDYSILFALQRELEGLREDPEVDDLSQIKKLVKELAPSLTGRLRLIELGIQQEFIAQFQAIELEF